ncbi:MULTISPECIES: hypothetical protein [Pseudomonadota]|jgi:hypothetical protein|uniref:hypothetical protein n=1 Tax=Pseudomonadota TaxID=1224 RepID=UPI000AB71608|nr:MULTISPECIES: hypothetical protein [Pseudomonadota]MBX3770304.1 hypothetical protein [Ralstonia pickettii]NOZ14832.1 hypothetical protein [Betaproteobacteria bacterium]MBC9966713.1 hypothetical protein [Ralstonia insidiosa]MBX3809276.1 hypothetical protein [Ralstonia pickettii]MBX3815470.1 hypothetical protein [Ralstonia insidiosa]
MSAQSQPVVDRRRQLLDELLHRMTVAQSIEVRVQLCAEAKRELDKIIPAPGGSQ